MTAIVFPLMLSMVTLQEAPSRDTEYQQDTIGTGPGKLVMTFFGHASLMIRYEGKTVYLDPVERYADYAALPKADLILVTHQHSDHFDLKAIGAIRSKSTAVIATELCAHDLIGGTVMRNGDTRSLEGITIEAIPAYNLVHKRDNGMPFHPKGEGNGYVLTFGHTRVYIAGDTENIPEMKSLRDVTIAFLPMNLPYTMTPEMVADAARAFKPSILYPYHYGDTDPQVLVRLLQNEPGIDVRVRSLR